MLILGVESTAHTFSIGIVTSDGKILANVKDSFTSMSHGMIPGEIAAHHTAVAEKVLTQVFTATKFTWKDIDIISYSAGPGLDPVLWAGYNKVQEWSKIHHKKIVGVNHCTPHLSIANCGIHSKTPVICMSPVSILK